MAPQNYERARALLEKYLEGKCTPEERELLEKWYDGLGEGTSDNIPSALSDQRRQQFMSRFRNSAATVKIHWWNRPVTRWAAASILLVAGAGFLWRQNRIQQPAQLALNKVVRVTNESNHIKYVILPDSSQVWLNAHASLSWKENFNIKERNVELSGEGYFDIRASEKNPFIIRTRDITIGVLGTQFNVEAYTKEKITRVSLVKGKVQVQARTNNHAAAVLSPGFAATWQEGAAAMNIHETDPAQVAAWKEGAFTAADIPLKDAVERLCSRYNYTVNWTGTQGIHKNITVMFRHESFEKMLSNICYISRKQYTIADRQVSIY
ncbi:MAG TPA: FecR domain-containing protein [Chitinophaga sp.]|uniref:FecR family protein n=1 Tax=Chitinophaga sp. TaxID=1869181 RepID=UPI002BDBFB1B|nr:FecR domain-containing protein [Chitinophaga sp.]HVI45291.1 FecR domain-containing protein [Chitinophaga sp.]